VTTEEAIKLFNVDLYALYFYLWLVVSVTFFILSSVRKSFGLGVVFIALIYIPGRYIDIAWSAESIFAVEALCLVAIYFIFSFLPQARNLMKYSGWVFTRVILTMMFFNATFIIVPGVWEFIPQFLGNIDGYPVNGEFLRVQFLNFLWCLLCLGVVCSGYKDFSETDDGKNMHKNIIGSFKSGFRTFKTVLRPE